MITLCNIVKNYGMDGGAPVRAVAGVDLEIRDGDFLVITGRSGSGKTTLLNIVAGLTKASAGEVLYDGVDVWRLPDRQQSLFRNRNVGFVFQFPSLMPSLTSLENVLLPTTFFADDESAVDRTVRGLALLRRVGLEDKAAAYPRQLSAGQQQRVVIARALVNRPCVLFADEPTSDLDEQTELEIMSLFRQIHTEMGVTVILVTHSSELTAYGTHALHMTAGRLDERVPPPRRPRTDRVREAARVRPARGPRYVQGTADRRSVVDRAPGANAGILGCAPVCKRRGGPAARAGHRARRPARSGRSAPGLRREPAERQRRLVATLRGRADNSQAGTPRRPGRSAGEGGSSGLHPAVDTERRAGDRAARRILGAQPAR